MDFGRNWLCYVFIVALSSCLPTNVQAFASMPLSTRTAHQQSSHNRGGRVIPPHFSAFRATRAGCLGHQAIAPPPSSVVAYLSSPFDSSEYEKEEVAKRQSEELEEMIRGRRGVVVEMVEREWQEELMKTIESEGERLCAMAYEGFQTRGKGAIFVNVDLSLSSNRRGHEGATSHALYRSLEEVVTERSSRVQSSDQMEIIQRCQEYDPEAGFVIVFGHKGLVGVQVTHPSIAPKEVHRTHQDKLG